MGSPRSAMGTPETREDVFPRHRRIEIRHAIQHGDAGRTQHDARVDEIPLDELAGGEALLHPEPFSRPEVDEVKPLLMAHPPHLVESPMAEAHTLEVPDFSRAEVSALAREELLGGGPAARQAEVEDEPLEVGRAALLLLTAMGGNNSNAVPATAAGEHGPPFRVLHGAVRAWWLGRALASDEVNALSEWFRARGVFLDARRAVVACLRAVSGREGSPDV